jgi:hypothetical protein
MNYGTFTFNEKGNLEIRDAKLLPGGFRNFEGRLDQFNKGGTRSFCVLIPADVADDLEKEGWNVKQTNSENPEDAEYFIKVEVSYKRKPPRAIQVTSRNKISLHIDNIAELDRADIRRVDLEIYPYHWDVNGKTGIKGYLGTIYATIYEDPFYAEYYGDDPVDDDEMLDD